MPETTLTQLYLPGIASNLEEGRYKDLIDGSRGRGEEYSKTWELFAFRESFTVHLASFSEGVLRSPASISNALRELIAAFTSYQNECRFCTQAHAAAAADLFGSETLVWMALTDLEASPLEAREKALLRFTSKITTNLPAVTGEDVEEVRARVVRRSSSDRMIEPTLGTLTKFMEESGDEIGDRYAAATFSRMVRLWYQLNCAGTACTIGFSGQASARARMYFRLRGKNPFTSGKDRFRSVASRSTTFAPTSRVSADRGCRDRSSNTAGRFPADRQDARNCAA